MPPALSPPQSLGQFVSSSGRTVIQYFIYQSGPWTSGPGSNYRGPVQVATGFEQAEVFLCGVTFRADAHSAGVKRAMATINKYQYDPTTGDFEVGVIAELATDGQPFAYEITFVVVLTDAAAARFTRINTSRGGNGTVSIARTLPNAVPPTMHYIGLGTRNWDVGISTGPTAVNRLGAHLDSLSITPPQVTLSYLGSCTDASMTTPMFLEWDASVIAFDPTEMAQNASQIFPQYTVLGHNVSAPAQWTEQALHPSGLITGFLDALEGVAYWYGPGTQQDIWEMSCAATMFKTSFGGNVGRTDYRIFLGDTFGNSATASPYSYQMSRAFGFLL